MTDPLRVLFVCTANICRSPAMELISRDLAGRADVVFGSSGTHARDGEPMYPEMVATLPAGMADDFRSRHLTSSLLLDADLVLTAEARHRQHILDDHPSLHRRLFTLGQFAATIAAIPADGPTALAGRELVAAAGQRRVHTTPEHDVADPFRRGRKAAEKATGTITAMLSDIVPRLTGVTWSGGRRALPPTHPEQEKES
jgi:protein-tyrosine-phosphatase